MSYEPVVLGYERISGGDWKVTVSLAPGRRVHLQMPAASFHAGHVAELLPLVIQRLNPAVTADNSE